MKKTRKTERDRDNINCEYWCSNFVGKGNTKRRRITQEVQGIDQKKQIESTWDKRRRRSRQQRFNDWQLRSLAGDSSFWRVFTNSNKKLRAIHFHERLLILISKGLVLLNPKYMRRAQLLLQTVLKEQAKVWGLFARFFFQIPQNF